MNGAITVVVGADTGIGAALALMAKANGHPVLAACLSEAPSLTAAGVEVLPGVDVTSDDAVALLEKSLVGRSVAMLVFVAGIVRESPFGGLDFAAMLDEYEVNALGFLRVAQVVTPRMGAGGKIGVLTSRVGSLGDNSSGGMYGYRMSKAAANMAALNLAHELAPRQIAVLALHPGTVRTQLTAALLDRRTAGLAVEPDVAAAGLLARLDELTMETTGTFRHANGELLPW
ncbi:MAG TPA: SDR family NAD(P)-dependent oxidoreductase [Sporichthyaceae bacterium]|jgi:NAD(P)-dependent dehydrogenase (short-subunit alcohol dehydrogenase family)